MDNAFELGAINYDAARRLATQIIIPRLLTEVFPKKGSDLFRLRDEVFAILDDEVKKGNLTQDQLRTTFRNAKDDGNVRLASCVRWYVRNILVRSGEITLSDTAGYYFFVNAEPIDGDDQDDESDGVEPLTGSIYAYTFPSYNGNMIKVGKAAGNVEDRIYQQLGTANPESPVILHIWSEANFGAIESAIHSILKARNKQVDAPKAKEWFRTSVEEVDAIIKFVNNR